MRRLSLSLLIVVLLSTIGLGWAIDRLFSGLVSSDQDGLQVYREMGANLIAAAKHPDDLQALVSRWPESSSVHLRLLEGSQLALPDELASTLALGEPLIVESDDDIELLFALPDKDYLLSLLPPSNRVETRLRVLLTMLFYGGIVLLVLLWIYPLSRRLHALGRTAKAFGEGNLSERVATSNHSYLRNIEAEFNSMAGRIQHLVADNKMLASAVSHDLRTPLARLRFGIDLLDETNDEAVRAEYQQRLSNDLTAMENLVEVLLEYARLDRNLSDMPTTTIDLNAVVSDAVDALQSQSQVQVHWDKPDTPTLASAHPRYVAMLVNNLLQNAVNYGRSSVHVHLVRKRQRLILTVEDDGPGIAPAMRERVLQPFVRGDSTEKNTDGKGYGMGLAIVSRIAHWHDADFKIDESDDFGGAKLAVGFRPGVQNRSAVMETTNATR